MLELMLCSFFTLLPDYLFRRYGQNKRFGHELTIYSVWYELRYGITGCLMLTISLITVVFYNHPAAKNVTALFRTVPILPEAGGRVTEIYVGLSADVEKGAPLFKLDSARQQAAFDLAVRKIVEVDASLVLARAELAATEGQIEQAKGAYNQALDELKTKQELQRRSPGTVAPRDIERLERLVEERTGSLKAAEASKQASEAKISTALPAEKASAEAARAQAQVDLDKTVIYAGVSGRVEQFVLRVGDFVSPMLRPAGILIPAGGGRSTLVAGFGQVEAQVMKIGMAVEVSCVTKPWTIIPMVVTQIQDYIASGQVRAGEQLIDLQQLARPGTMTVFLEPMFKDGLEDIPPGSSCVANAYSNNHEELSKKDIGFGRWLYLHIVDTVSLVHALILRLEALVFPFKILVFGGH